MFVFIGKLIMLVMVGGLLGVVIGSISESPEIGVAAFLIFTVSFRAVVFGTVPKE